MQARRWKRQSWSWTVFISIIRFAPLRVIVQGCCVQENAAQAEYIRQTRGLEESTNQRDIPEYNMSSTQARIPRHIEESRRLTDNSRSITAQASITTTSTRSILRDEFPWLAHFAGVRYFRLHSQSGCIFSAAELIALALLCLERKIKCDGRTPTCWNCEKRQSVCNYVSV